MAEGGSPEQLPVTVLKGVGSRVAEKLERLSIRCLQDLLFHLPLRYEDRSHIVPLSQLHVGMSAAIQVEVIESKVVFRGRRSLLAMVSDGSGFITLRLFFFNAAQQARYQAGSKLICYGEVRRGASTLEMVHPECRAWDDAQDVSEESGLTPIYPTTEGVHQLKIRGLVDQVLDRDILADEWLPDSVLQAQGFPPLAEAVRFLHRPPVDTSLTELLDGRHPAQRRLAFEEILAHNLAMQRMRARARSEPARSLAGKGTLAAQLVAGLPFALTTAQRRVGREIVADISQSIPMQRLVQGDVGSGKTIVAAIACLYAVERGYQAAVMAPTEILSEQHRLNFENWLQPLGLKVAWLTSKQPAKQKRQTMQEVASGEAQIVIGTHALFQKQVVFSNLALVVVDEQHRFGVHQRLALKEKGKADGFVAHQLIMTATPIPRTLAMTAYSDLDVSVIDELPPGRKPVTTVALPNQRRDDVIERIREACEHGRQAYWVCTLIEESELLQAQAAEEATLLLTQSLPGYQVELVHGRMKPAEKDLAMSAFKRGETHVLVATTVIEVGVDVPNASVMVIENAERLGLSQLHQLRGRVGRGSQQSVCLLMYQSPLSDQARDRIEVMRDTTDGFRIAEHDLRMRGPGEVLGTRQTGAMQFRIADIARDADLLGAVARLAKQLSESDSAAVQPLIDRWIGRAEQYGEV